MLTKVDSRTRTGRDADRFLKDLNIPRFKVDIPRLVAFERSPSRGVIIKDYPDPRSKLGWSKYMAVGREILT